MGLANYAYNRSTSGGEIITNLINASDGAGLHFNGTSGYIDIASPPDLGTKFSFEYILQADSWDAASIYLTDFGSSGRFIFGSSTSGTSDNLAASTSGWASFGVNPLTDLKVHHLVLTVDDTSIALYDNGNQIATATLPSSPTIDSAADASIGSLYNGAASWFNGTIYRARFFNRVLSSADVTSVYESASIDYADQWGAQTSLVDAAASVFTSGTYSWVAAGSNTIANVSNTLAITYVNNASGAYNYLRNAADLTTDLTVGKKYRLTVDAKYAGGSSGSRLKLNDGASNFYSANLTTSLVNYTFEFTARTTAVAPYIQLDAMTASNVVTIDNWYVRAIGVSADFDLAFANPTQSTIVQDRAGVADATAAGGVTQISPIEQLNTKALSVSTSALTPPEGEISVSKSIDWAAAQTIKGRLGWGDGYVYVGSNTANGILKLVSGNGVAAATVSSAGTVSITRASTDPTASFTSNSQIVIGASGNTPKLAISRDTNGDNAYIHSYEDGVGAKNLVLQPSGGGVGIGTTSSAVATQSTDMGIFLDATNGRMFATATGHHDLNRTTAGEAIRFRMTHVACGDISVSSGATAYNTSSDYRLKENVTELTGALDRLDSIPVYNFNFKSDPTRTVDGFLAHEVSEFVPEAITGTKDEMETVVVTPAVAAVEAVPATLYVEGDELPEGKAVGDEKTPAVEAVEAVAEVTEEQPKYQGIDQSKLVPLMLAAIKELKAKVETLENA